MKRLKLKGKQRRARTVRRGPDPGATQRDAAGRVHLRLHEDGAGRRFVTLQSPVFDAAWQNELARAAAESSLRALEPGPTLERTTAVTREVMRATSRLADGLLARAANGTVACKAGCDHCCHQSVGVTPPEAFTIVQHLKQTLTEELLEARRARIAAAFESNRGLSTEQRFSPEHPCPFLDDGQCSIYEVRPLSCRGMNSLDDAECARNLRDPQSRERFLERGAGGQSFLEPIRAFHAMSAGLQLGISELFALDMRPLDLVAACHLLLQRWEPLVEAWLHGAPALVEARGGDATADVTSHELSGRRRRAEPRRA